MSKPTAIRVSGLGKQYRIGLRDSLPETLVETLSSWLSSPVRNFRRLRSLSRFSGAEDDSTIWALRDVSFDVAPGEVLGVIGRNGAGKTTLLKILSRITDPSVGRAEVRGRVSSLLEVGTGFHPELTGRENIYLNGTILGMTKLEIDRKFDQIVAFSGVERFVDTPVKRYSSGMKVRLAFSVAAHLEPEILLIDEVLAVGDIEFQRKCLGKMRSVAQSGRTVIFVSHQLGAVASLCDSGLVLESGRVAFHGDAGQAIETYSERVLRGSEEALPGRAGWGGFVVNGHPVAESSVVVSGDVELSIEAKLRLDNGFVEGRVFLIVDNSTGDQVLHETARFENLERGLHTYTVDLPVLWLAPGVYSFHLKFIGSGARTVEARSESQPALFVVRSGQTEAPATRSILAPRGHWTHGFEATDDAPVPSMDTT